MVEKKQMGRPKKELTQKKKRLVVYVSDTERTEIEAAARAAGLDVSPYVVGKVLE